MGPVRVNRRGMSIGGGVGVGPVGFGYGKRIASFNGNSGPDNSVRDLALGAMIFNLPLVLTLVLIMPLVYLAVKLVPLAVKLDKVLVLPIQTKLKPIFARFRVTKTPLLLMALFGGFLGIHHYALGRIRRGLINTITLGYFGISWARDIYLIVNNKLLDVMRARYWEIKSVIFAREIGMAPIWDSYRAGESGLVFCAYQVQLFPYFLKVSAFPV